jgi:peptidoglycan hydrolase CwlO-like protein
VWNVLEYRPNDEKVAVMLLVAVVSLVGAFSFGHMLGIRNVHDNGAGTQPIANELGQAGTAIENAGAGINEAQDHAGNVQAGIDNATEQADYIHGTAKTSTELIGQCQSIIDQIRKRANTDKVTH